MENKYFLKSHKHIGAHHDLVVGETRFLLLEGKITTAVIESFDNFNASVKLPNGAKLRVDFNLIYMEKPENV